MPFLIRIIIQRSILGLFSVLAFFGFSPQVNILTEEEAKIAIEDRQQRVQDFFTDTDFTIPNSLQKISAQTEDSETTEIKTNESPIPPKPTAQTQPAVNPQPPIIPQSTTSPENTTTEVSTTVQNLIEQNNQIPETIDQSTQTRIENVVYNIICLNRNGNTIKAHTGSGVSISPSGVVLTNAHVAQYFLLKDPQNPNFMNCTLYRENLPAFGYKAQLLYIPPNWVEENFQMLKDPNPKGDGKRDYAFLLITKNTNPTSGLPIAFDYAPVLLNSDYTIGNRITLAAYPGAPTKILDLARSVSLRIDENILSNVFTLGNNQIDIISSDITQIAERGASGGGVFENNNLVGIIVSTSLKSGGANLNALTTSYINRNLINETGQNISSLISGNLPQKANQFQNDWVPILRGILLSAY